MEDNIKDLLGEEIDTDEQVLVYPKEHIQKVYQAAVKQDAIADRMQGQAKMLMKAKAIQLLKDMPFHTKQNRVYFEDVKKITLALTLSNAEMQFFNSRLDDEKFAGYCYSFKLNKILRVYDNKCYATIMHSDPGYKQGTAAGEIPTPVSLGKRVDPDEHERFMNEDGCKCPACYDLWMTEGRVHVKGCGVHDQPPGECNCQNNGEVQNNSQQN